MDNKFYIMDESVLKMIICGRTSRARTIAAVSFLGFALMTKVAIDFAKEIKEKDETIDSLEDTVRTLDAKLNNPNPEWNRRSDI